MLKKLILSTAFLFAAVSLSSAQSFLGLPSEIFADPNATTESWDNLTPTNYPSYPSGMANYPGGKLPDTVANVTPTAINPAVLIHVNGASSYTTASIQEQNGYWGIHNPSTKDYNNQYRVQKDSVIDDLQTIGFLIESTAASQGYFVNAPVLIINGDYVNSLFTADFSTIANTGTITGGTTVSTQHYYQWDLSGYTDPITSFAIEFTVARHSLILGLQASQSDIAYGAAAIPEPSTYALIGAGLAGAAFLRRRRRAA